MIVGSDYEPKISSREKSERQGVACDVDVMVNGTNQELSVSMTELDLAVPHPC